MKAQASRIMRPWPPLLVVGCTLFLLAGMPLFAQQLATGEGPGPITTAAPSQLLPVAPKPVTKFTFHDRIQDYWLSTYQPSSLIFVAGEAAYDQAINYPPEWKQGWNAYGKRLLSDSGILVASHTIRFGVAALDHEDPRYVPCDCPRRAIFRRVGHVFLRSVVSPRDGGGSTFAFSRIGGAYGAGFIANAWYPAGHSNIRNAVYLGTFTMVTDTGANFLREFIRLHIVRWGP